jgi:hypothetical protein
MLRAQLLCVLVALLLCGAAMAAGKSNVAKKKTHSASNLFVTEYDPGMYVLCVWWDVV